MFGTLPPMVWYVGLGTCAMTRSHSLPIGYIQKSWCLNFVSSATAFSVSAIREMLAAGIWNCVIKLQQILQDGLSLLVTNLLISPHFMGLLSIAQLVPTTMSGLMGTISGLFSPEQTKFFRSRPKRTTATRTILGYANLRFFS